MTGTRPKGVSISPWHPPHKAREVVEWLTITGRFLQLAGMLSAFGALLFRLLIAPRAMEGGRALPALIGASLLLALFGGLVRLLAESAVVNDAGSVAAAVAAIPEVIRFSRFGTFLAAQLAFIVLALALHGGVRAWRPVARAALVGGALVLAAGSGHAAALPDGEGRLLWAVETLHLFAAGGWLGGLAPLFFVLRAAPIERAARMVRRFSMLAMVLVGALALSALIQGVALIGGFGPLLATDYGRLALIKLGLFALLLGLAARNRLVLLPALEGAAPMPALYALRSSLARGMALGLMVLLAASLLASWGPVLPGR